MNFQWIVRLIKRLWRKQGVVTTAIQEVGDLVPLVDNMEGVLTGVVSLAGELRKALEDGDINPSEAARLLGRANDFEASGRVVLKEVKEAIAAIKTLVSVVQEPNST